MTPSQILIELTFEEFRRASDLPTETLRQMIEEGILAPRGDSPGSWRFEAHLVATARRASRLHRDLDINWSGTALALELLDELEALRDENRVLRRRLARFLDE